MSALPLAGRRIVVTRASEQATGLTDRLTALGAVVVVVSLIEITESSDGGAAAREALAHLDGYDWLVITSPNGADRVADAVRAAGDRSPQLAAVGTATARTLTEMSGRPVDLVPDRQIAEALVDAFPNGEGSVLIAQAEDARSVLSDGLVAKGWDVDVVAVYRTRAVRPSSRDLLGALSADAVLFASGSAVRSWHDAFGDALPPVAIAIGPATAAVAEDLRLKIDAVATDHSLDGLVAALLTLFSDTH